MAIRAGLAGFFDIFGFCVRIFVTVVTFFIGLELERFLRVTLVAFDFDVLAGQAVFCLVVIKLADVLPVLEIMTTNTIFAERSFMKILVTGKAGGRLPGVFPFLFMTLITLDRRVFVFQGVIRQPVIKRLLIKVRDVEITPLVIIMAVDAFFGVTGMVAALVLNPFGEFVVTFQALTVLYPATEDVAFNAVGNAFIFLM